MKCYLDTNVLLYYTFEASNKFKQARDLLISLRVDEADLFISTLTIDEFSHQLDYLSRINKKKRKDYFEILSIMMKGVLELPFLQVVNPPASKLRQYDVIELMKKYSLKPRDAYHLLTMLEENIEYLATYDNDFSKVFKSGIIKKY